MTKADGRIETRPRQRKRETGEGDRGGDEMVGDDFPWRRLGKGPEALMTKAEGTRPEGGESGDGK